MLKTIFTKSMYERRMSMLFWAIGIMAVVLLTMSVYPSFKQPGGLGDSLQNLPKGIQGLVGDASTFKTVPGYVGQQIFALRAPVLLIIFSLILTTGILAGEEADGTLQTLLIQPVSRTRVLLEKLLAILAISAVVSLALVVGVELALVLIREHFSLFHLFEATFDAWLIAMVFAVFSFMVAAVTGKKGLASGLGAAATFACYLINSLAPSVNLLKGVDKLIPFHYYNNPIVAQHGLHGSHVALLAGAIALMSMIALIGFNRRDIYQR